MAMETANQLEADTVKFHSMWAVVQAGVGSLPVL